MRYTEREICKKSNLFSVLESVLCLCNPCIIHAPENSLFFTGLFLVHSMASLGLVTHYLGTVGEASLTCGIASKTTGQHLHYRLLRCSKPIEGIRESPSLHISIWGGRVKWSSFKDCHPDGPPQATLNLVVFHDLNMHLLTL